MRPLRALDVPVLTVPPPRRHAAGAHQMANMLEGGGKTPIMSPEELQAMGFSLVAYPLSLWVSRLRRGAGGAPAFAGCDGARAAPLLLPAALRHGHTGQPQPRTRLCRALRALQCPAPLQLGAHHPAVAPAFTLALALQPPLTPRAPSLGVGIRAMQDALTGLKRGRVPGPREMGTFVDIQMAVGFPVRRPRGFWGVLGASRRPVSARSAALATSQPTGLPAPLPPTSTPGVL
jgi:hypothetical protein